MSRLSVIVVSYNTHDILRRCLASLGDADEVIVVDNGSVDKSADMVAEEFPQVRLIRNQTNRGFGAANNQGLDVMTGDVALLLNSDCQALPKALHRMLEVMDTVPGVVACGGRLEHPDGRLQQSCCSPLTLWAVFCEQSFLEKIFRGSPVFDPYWLSARLIVKSDSDVFEVAQVMGACLMMRPVERFDERFFLYCEDTELCRRLSNHGIIMYVPEAAFVHELGSSTKVRWQAVARYNRGKELYFLIHHDRLSWRVAVTLDRFGAVIRLLGWGVAAVATLGLWERARTNLVGFFRVLTAPLEGPPLPADSRG